MKELLAAGLRTFGRFAQFGGRSTRTELIGLWALLMLASLPLVLFVGTATPLWVWLGLNIVTAIPAPALFVRRAHDVGWSGWWLLPLIPIAAVNVWERVLWLQPPDNGVAGLPWWVDLALAPFLLALLVLLVWDDDPDTNRFGPNPRAGD